MKYKDQFVQLGRYQERYNRVYTLSGGTVTIPDPATNIAAIWRLSNTDRFAIIPPLTALKLAVCDGSARYLFQTQWTPEYPIYNGELLGTDAVIELVVDGTPGATEDIDDIELVANYLTTAGEEETIAFENPPGVYDTPFSGFTLIYAQ